MALSEKEHEPDPDAMDGIERRMATRAGDQPRLGTESTIASIEKASAARVYDAWLGGKDNFAVDREVAARVVGALPWLPVTARANRRFLVRSVRFLAERGVRQFLDVGSGLPTAPNVHEVAQRVHRDARVVYVDHDPMVVTYGQVLLAGDGQTVVVRGDARDPVGILSDPVVAQHLDWSQPVGVLLVAVLHFLTDRDDPGATVAMFRAAMAPGGGVVISHAVPGPPEHAEAMAAAVAVYGELAVPIVPRAPETVAGWLDGLSVVAPGVVRVDRWQVRGVRDWWPGAVWSPSGRGTSGPREIHGVAGVGLVGGTAEEDGGNGAGGGQG